MNAEQLVTDLSARGVRLWTEEGELRFRAPRGVIDDDRRALLKQHKPEILTLLATGPAAGDRAPEQAGSAADRTAPFPLTDVQAAYLVGRTDAFPYGGVACHAYVELAWGAEEDPARIAAAWRRLVERHPMLRAIVHPDGHQQVLADAQPPTVPVADLRDLDPPALARRLEAVRAELARRTDREPQRLPLVALQVSRCADQVLAHISADLLVVDHAGLQLLVHELRREVAAPGSLGEVSDGPTFRDCVLARRTTRASAAYERDRSYWWGRIDELAAAPELPLAEHDPMTVGPRFRRRVDRLDPEAWATLRERATAHGVTASSVVLGAYAETIGRWSRHPRFLLNLPVSAHTDLPAGSSAVVGDFTAVELLSVDLTAPATVAERSRELGTQLLEDLSHPRCAGTEILAELSRRRHAADGDGRDIALAPVVFTSALGVGTDASPDDDPTLGGRVVQALTQTPQVWIDCQAMPDAGGVLLSWDVREGILADGVADAAFAAYISTLRTLVDDPGAWERPFAVPLPPAQAARRRQVNATAGPLPTAPLHAGILAAAERTPGAPALVAATGEVSFDELVRHAAGVAARLREDGVTDDRLVAVVAPPGPEAVVAVLATLLAGAAYVPIDVAQPPARRDAILADAGIRHVLTVESRVGEDDAWPEGTVRIAIDGVEPSATRPDLAPADIAPDRLAYVIYTSGSTGSPKGVMTTHRAALNTVADISRRFGVGPEDRMLALAGLGFDLSVYDLFGPLAAGGALVLPTPERRGDPSHLAALIARHGVTLWNSVPAQAQMLESYLRAAHPGGETAEAHRSLRLALLSGDWLPVTLPDALRDLLPDLTVVSLGGATEGAIWSIHHPIGEVDRSRPSIPYGTPLTNQAWTVHDHLGRDRPDLVPGELIIEGAGVAAGYLGDAERTTERFSTTPDGTRRYRTGDLGRYGADGVLEFLGREDAQVKVRGYRIELAEVEAALLSHPAVGACAVQVTDVGGTRGLVGVVEPEVRPAPDRTADDDPRASVTAEAGARALAALEAAAAEVDHAALADFLTKLDEYALVLMTDTLAAAGVLTDPDRTWTAAEVAEVLGADEARGIIVRRWLRALADRGRIERDPDGRLRGALGADLQAREGAWSAVEAAEGAVGWSPELLRHIRESGARLPELLRGTLDVAELLYPGAPSDAIDAAYRDNLGARLQNEAVTAAMVALAEANDAGEPLRVLEVRGGVGGTTDHLATAMAGHDVQYTFSDPSMFFVGEARDRHRERDWMRFVLFDPSAPAAEQGPRPNSVDVVLCSNGLHGVADVPATLAVLRGLLTPGGHLVLVESTRADNPPLMVATDFLEVRAGGPRDGRRHEDALLWTAPGWRELLADAGGTAVQQAPAAGDPLEALGQHLLIAQVKADRERPLERGLHEHVAARLPEYMVPARWTVLDSLPVTANGKVDRAALARLVVDPADGTGAAAATVGDEPRDETERRLAEIWAELLGRSRVGREEDFFALGGDSLLVARLVGRMREGLPEVRSLEWDVVLRHMLRRPTVAGLAGYVRSLSAESGPDGSGATGPVMPALSLLAGSGAADRPATVLVHAGVGTIMPYRSLMTEIRRRSRGANSLYGLEIPDLDRFLDEEPDGLIDRTGVDYARELLATGARTFHIVGYCLGGLIATEVARALSDAGAEIASFTAISSHSPDFRLDDELVSEYSFAMMIGIDPADLGFPADQWRVAAAGAEVLRRTPGVMAAGGYAALEGEWDDVGRTFRELEAIPRSGRIARMCEAVPPAVGSYTPQQMMRFFRTFRQSVFAITRYDAEPYLGDITFLRHNGAYPFPGSRDAVTVYWERLVLGELEIVDIPGDHYSCLSTEHSPGILGELARITDGAVIA